MVREASFKIQNSKTKTALTVFVFCALLLPTSMLQGASFKLQVVAVRDNIPGSFTTAQALYADESRIYLVSHQGTLFVLARNHAQGFPLLESIEFASPLTAVVASKSKLYVSAGNGSVYIFEIPRSAEGKLRKLETKLVNDYGVGSLSVAIDGSVIAGLGQARVATSADHVFVSGLNEGDDAFILEKGIRLPFKAGFKATDVYNLDGKYMGTISNYFSGAISISTSLGEVYMAKPGCCGMGVAVYDASTNELTGTMPVRFANTVTIKNNLAIIGTEAGTAHLASNAHTIDSVDLKQLTGHTGAEDIEIRALWADNYDDFIFAASSWGNDSSRSDSLPSFFVIELVQEISDKRTVNSHDSSLPARGEGQGEAGNIARGIISISTVQASEMDKTQIEPTINTGITSSSAEVDLADKSVYDYLTKFFLTISNAFKFLFGLIM